MKAVLFQDLDLADRLKQIQAESVKVEAQEYSKPLTSEELTQLKEEQALLAVKLYKLEKKKKRFLEHHNEMKKPVQNKNNQVLEAMDTQVLTVEGDVYAVPAHDENLMYFVDDEGHVINARALSTEEQQLNFHLSSHNNLAVAVQAAVNE